MESHGSFNPGDDSYDDVVPVPMPPIRGVRAPDPFNHSTATITGAKTAPYSPPLVAGETADEPDFSPHLIPASAIDPWGVEPIPDSPAADPWGVDESTAEEVEEDQESAESETDEGDVEEELLVPVPARRGGGTLTIPLMCVGVAVIACTTLLPLADENHRLAWEREKLRQDYAQIREQVRVNDEFLKRVADDPTLAERLAQRQMKYIRQGASVLQLRGGRGLGLSNQEMSPFHLVAVPSPKPLPPYQPVGGVLALLVRNPRHQLYLSGGAMLLIAAGLVLGYVPRETDVRCT